MKTLKAVTVGLVLAATAYAGDGIFDNVRASGVPSGYFYYGSLEVSGRGGVIFRGTGEGTTNLYNIASGYSNAFIYDAGLSSVSLGDIYLGSFSGRNSMTVGSGNVLTGNNSLAAGYASTASGAASVALNSGIAAGNYSTAVNGGATSGSYSFAQGGGTASGSYAAGFGGASAASFYSVAIGRFNTTTDYTGAVAVNGTTWTSSDPIFNIGIGSSTSDKKDAFIVYKSGQVKIPKRQGDIIMGEFGNGNGD